MAESNQRKFAEPIDLSDDDPFAELTRIMGFDPRVVARGPAKENPEPAANADMGPAMRVVPAVAPAKVAPVAVAPIAPRAVEPAPAPAAEPHDDFGIDLEKELLGEFADFDASHEPVAAEPSAPIAEVAAPVVRETIAAPADFDSEFEDAFAAVVDDAAGHADTTAEGPAPADAPAPAHAAAHDTQLDDALAAELEFRDFDLDEPSAQVVPVEALAAAAASGEPGAGEPEPALDLNFDEIELEEPAAEVQANAPVTDEQEPDLDLNLDDVDFNEPSHEPVAAGEPATARIADQPESDLDLEIGALDIDEPSMEAELLEPAAEPTATEPAEPLAASQPAPSIEAAPARDPFAEVDMDFSAAFDREFANRQHDDELLQSQAPQAAAADDDPIDIWDVHPAQQTPDPKAADPVELSIEEELDRLLGAAQEQPRTTEPDAPRPAPEPVHTPFSYDSRWSSLTADEEDAPVEQDAHAAAPAPVAQVAGGQRRSFSDPSLIARHANFQTPPPKPTNDLDDLLDAMEHEAHAGASPIPVGPKPQGKFSSPVPATQGVKITYADQADDQPAQDEAGHPVAGYDEETPAGAAYDAAPEIETVEVPETAVAIAHDLDIPELAYEDDKPQAPAYDDIDADFAAAFQDNKPNEEPVNQIVRGVSRPTERADVDSDFEAYYQPSYADAGHAAMPEGNVVAFQPAAATSYRYEAPQQQSYDDFDAAAPAATAGRDRFVDFDFESDTEEMPAQGTATVEPPRRRGLLIAAIVGGVAVLGGVGALALSFGGGESADAPALVKADDSPVKIKPENPGGTTVPNQDNKVYDAVKGTAAATEAATQQKLVTTSEEPVDVAAIAAENGSLPGVNADEDIPQTTENIAPTAEENIVPKAEDRIDPVAEASEDAPVDEGAVVAPRKVKTMIVRADGTLVPREEVATTTDAAAEAPAAPAGDDKTGTVAAEADPTSQSAGDAVPVQPVKTKKVASAEPAPEASALPPAQPAKKADAPKTDEVAAAEPAAPAEPEPVAAAAGAWSVQIASQPSAESAKSTYQDLARRYAGVIGGKGVNIVKAEIAGKGTYWRVRVPAKSRDEAVGLCNDYKAAGGNCFISK